MEIVVIGMGYVGIPTAALLASVDGFNVVGLQRRSKRSGWKIDHINSGLSPIEGDEPGLGELIKDVVTRGKLRVTDSTEVLGNADVIVITVQTPVDENNVPRYESLREVATTIGGKLRKGCMVCLESTVAPGTTQNVVRPILEEASGLTAGVDFNLVFSYERVMVSRLLYNLRNMPKIVGGLTPECTSRAVEFYGNIVQAEIYPTDCMTAEVSKVTENTYRDVNIAFANEVALMCESLGVNVHEVREYVNSLPDDPLDPAKNPRRNMHIPGAGVGGHCLPKDPWLLKYGVDTYGRNRVEPRIIVDSRRVNDGMPVHMKNLIVDALGEKGIQLEDAKITILGYAFLGDSDDVRNTPAKPLYGLLIGGCRELVVHDPYVSGDMGIEITGDLESAVSESDCIALVTNHQEYYQVDLEWLKTMMRTPVIIDGRYVFKPEECTSKGFTYRGVGVGI